MRRAYRIRAIEPGSVPGRLRARQTACRLCIHSSPECSLFFIALPGGASASIPSCNQPGLQVKRTLKTRTGNVAVAFVRPGPR